MIGVFFFLLFLFFQWKCIFRNYDSGIPKVVSSPKWFGSCNLAKMLLIHRELNFLRGNCPKNYE